MTKATAPRTALSSTARVVSPRLIGRERELELLLDAVTHSPAVAVVEGEAGIGKSRLVGELSARLRELSDGTSLPKCRVLVGRCHRVREPFPLGPVLDAIRGLGAELGHLGLSPLAGVLRPFLPELAGQLPSALEPLGDAAAERHRTFRALAEVLAVAGPAVLLLDDLHWCDPDQTVEFLRFLVDEQPQTLALVLTFRTEEVSEELRAAIARLPVSTTSLTLGLEPLDLAATRELTGAILDTRDVSDGFAAYLHESTDGVPFAIEEVLALLRERGVLTQHGDRWERRRLASLGVPRPIRQFVAERVSRLSAQAQAVLEAAAVLEAPTPDTVVVEVASVAEDDVSVAEAIAECVRAGLLEERERALAFRHVLAAHAVYEGVPALRRRTLHSRAADALTKLDQPPLGQLAHHLKHADRVAEWAQVAEEAADQAGALGDAVAAARVLYEVLDRADLASETRIRVALKLGYAAMDCLAHSEALALLGGIVRDEALPSAIRGELRMLHSRLLHQAGDWSGGYAELEAAVEDLAERPDLRIEAMARLGLPTVLKIPMAEHVAWMKRALDTVGTVDDPVVQATVRGDAAALLILAGDPSWRDMVEQLPERACSLVHARKLVRIAYNVALAAIDVGHYRSADSYLKLGFAVADQPGLERHQLALRSVQVLLDYSRGEWDGLTEKVEALDAELAKFPVYRTGVAACLRLAHGDLATAHHRLDEASKRSGLVGLTLPAGTLTRLLLALGDTDDAIARALKCVDVLEAKKMWAPSGPAVRWAVAALVAAGRRDDAHELTGRFAGGLDGLDAPVATAALLACRGSLAAAAGHSAKAAQLFAAAANAYAALPSLYEAAQAREQAALAMFDAGEAAAERALRAALADFEKLGAHWDVARCRQAGRERGLKLPVPYRRGRKGYGDELSPREREVAELAAQRLTNKEIAERLFVSSATVDKHLGRAMAKAGVHARRDLEDLFDGDIDGHRGGRHGKWRPINGVRT